MTRKMIACDICGFMITSKEYAHNGGVCFECRDEQDGYEGNLGKPVREEEDY